MTFITNHWVIFFLGMFTSFLICSWFNYRRECDQEEFRKDRDLYLWREEVDRKIKNLEYKVFGEVKK